MKYQPLTYKNLNRYSISKRKSKVNVNNFFKLNKDNFFDSIPDILAAKDLKDIISFCVNAKKNGKKIIIATGAHFIKVGLSPLFKQLLENGIIDHIAMNGACIIHDAEIAMNGETSEDVMESLKDGNFGMSEETGKLINFAISEGFKKGVGLGEAIGEWLNNSDFKYKEYSVICNAYKNNIPVTIHVAIGTDIIHMHPECDGAAIGEMSLLDFKIFCNSIKDLSNGAYFNIGSAVIMPEVFLKAVTLVRNLGYKLENFITVNMDFIKHYRPSENVVKRPTVESGKGYTLIGHHEIMIPLLFGEIIKKLTISRGGTERWILKTH